MISRATSLIKETIKTPLSNYIRYLSAKCLKTFAALGYSKYVAAGAFHSCALDDDGVKCWGTNFNGEVNVPPLINPRSLALGYQHTCAIDDTGVKCWGDNSLGQLKVPLLLNPREIASFSYHTCAIDDEGVKCWGQNDQGQCDPPK